MKKIVAFTLVTIFLLAPAAFAGKGLPLTLAGITLGDDWEKYKACCDLKFASPMSDAPFLSEMHLKSDFIPGVRGGSLAYGNCQNKGKIVRIKLKFHNRGQKLFNDLLKKYEATYGKADSYAGDAFKNVIAWVWNFSEGDQRVNLMLMWSRDKEMRPGVSIKMTLESLLDEEYQCFKKAAMSNSDGKSAPSKIENLNDFVPK